MKNNEPSANGNVGGETSEIILEKKEFLEKLEGALEAEKSEVKRREEELRKFIAEEESEIHKMKEQFASFMSSEEKKLKSSEEKIEKAKKTIIEKEVEFTTQAKRQEDEDGRREKELIKRETDVLDGFERLKAEEERIVELSQKLESDVNGKESNLTSIGNSLNQRERNLNEKEGALEDRMRSISDKEDNLNSRERNLDEKLDEIEQKREDYLKGAEHEFKERAGKELALSKKALEIEKREELVALREKNLDESSTQLQAQLDSTSKREKELDEFEKKILSKKGDLDSRERKLDDLEKELLNSRELVAQKERELISGLKDDKKSHGLEDKLRIELSRKEDELKTLEKEVSRKIREIDAKDKEISIKDVKLLEKSTGWGEAVSGKKPLLGRIGKNPTLDKKATSKGNLKEVTLKAVNKSDHSISNVLIFDTLPNDATGVEVQTSSIPGGRVSDQMVWKIKKIESKDSLVIHYSYSTKNKMVYQARMEWNIEQKKIDETLSSPKLGENEFPNMRKLEEKVRSRETELSKKDAEIEKLSEKIKARDKKLSDKEREVNQLNVSVKGREREVSAMEKSLEKASLKFDMMERELSKKFSDLKSKERMVQEREREVEVIAREFSRSSPLRKDSPSVKSRKSILPVFDDVARDLSTSQERTIREEVRKIRKNPVVGGKKSAEKPVEGEFSFKMGGVADLISSSEPESPKAGRLRVDSESSTGLLDSLGGKPRILKRVDVHGRDVSVSLAIKNPSNKIIKNLEVVEVLPSDAEEFNILTSGFPHKQSGNRVVWSIPHVNKNQKRIIHYQVKSKETELPPAILEWDE